MIHLLESMLNMLKKKLVNNYLIIYVIFFICIWCSSFAFAKDFVFSQGNFTRSVVLKEVKTGVTKIELAGILGKPNFLLSKELNCWCYCYYELLNFYNFRVNYLILYFNDDVLVNFRFYNSYVRDNKYKEKARF